MSLPTLVFTELCLEGWPAMTKRDWNNACKAAWAKVGLRWVMKMLPRHFKPGAARQYRYADRKVDKTKIRHFWFFVETGMGQAAMKALSGRARKILRAAIGGILSRSERALLSQLRKLKPKGERPAADADLPLILTGKLRKETLGGKFTIRATKKGVRVGLTRPSHRLGQTQHDELRRVTARERKVLANLFVRELVRELNAYKGKKRKKLPGGHRAA